MIPVRKEVSAAEQQPTNKFAVSRPCGLIHRQASANQAEHHGNKAARHKACGADVELLVVLGSASCAKKIRCVPSTKAR